MSALNSTKPLIIITEKFSLEALIHLKQSGLFEVAQVKVPQLTDDHLQRAQGLIIRSQTKITADFLEKMPALKMIITCTSGFDHIDLTATQHKKIQVMYTPDANSQSAAELTWGLILSLHRNIFDSFRQIKAGLWDREPLVGSEVYGKTIGIIGLGRIGQKISRFAQAFGLKVVAFDPYQDDAIFHELNLERSSYEEVLKQADILSFHVPLTAETKNMLNRSHFEYTHKDVVIINTSRGSVINEDDLAEALESGLVKMAALDVFAKEPLGRDSKLIKSSKVILTTHIGALTEQAFSKASLEASNLCIDFFKNNKTKNNLPFENEWGSLMFQD